MFFLALTDRSPRRGDVCPSVCETRFGFFNKVKYIEVFKAVRKLNITFFFSWGTIRQQVPTSAW